MRGFAKYLVATLMMVAVQAQADYQTFDLLPWPWGSECPFPWTKIEGDWAVRDSATNERFTFTVKGVWENGTRVLEVRRFDGKNRLLGLGEGVAPKGERIVRAAMTDFGRDDGLSYWAIVRTYVEKRKMSCSRGKLVTVITLRPTDGSAEDVHLIVDKMDAEGKIGN